MTATVFSGIVGAMVAALSAGPAIAGQVSRIKLRPISKENPTAIVVRPADAGVEQGAGAGVPLIWGTVIAVSCYARGAASAPADQALDPVLRDAFARLMADQSLGGLAGGINPTGIAWEFDVDGENTACATLTFNVRHASAATTLT